jgi:hypothetical protein
MVSARRSDRRGVARQSPGGCRIVAGKPCRDGPGTATPTGHTRALACITCPPWRSRCSVPRSRKVFRMDAVVHSPRAVTTPRGSGAPPPQAPPPPLSIRTRWRRRVQYTAAGRRASSTTSWLRADPAAARTRYVAKGPRAADPQAHRARSTQPTMKPTRRSTPDGRSPRTRRTVRISPRSIAFRSKV